jgi:hypothetical protein
MGVESMHSALFAPDGQHLITIAGNGIRMWDVSTGQPGADLYNFRERVYGAQVSADGKRILSISTNEVRVWDFETGFPLMDPLPHDVLHEGQRLQGPERHNLTTRGPLLLSPDGKRIVTVSSGQARGWDIGPPKGRCPDWLLRLSEAISGVRLNKQGMLSRTALNRAESIQEIRRKLQESGDDDWTVWGRWFLADPATRSISPFSKVRVAE